MVPCTSGTHPNFVIVKWHHVGCVMSGVSIRLYKIDKKSLTAKSTIKKFIFRLKTCISLLDWTCDFYFQLKTCQTDNLLDWKHVFYFQTENMCFIFGLKMSIFFSDWKLNRLKTCTTKRWTAIKFLDTVQPVILFISSTTALMTCNTWW